MHGSGYQHSDPRTTDSRRYCLLRLSTIGLHSLFPEPLSAVASLDRIHRRRREMETVKVPGCSAPTQRVKNAIVGRGLSWEDRWKGACHFVQVGLLYKRSHLPRPSPGLRRSIQSPFSDTAWSHNTPINSKLQTQHTPTPFSSSKMVKITTVALALASAIPFASAKTCTDGLIYCGFNLRKIGG